MENQLQWFEKMENVYRHLQDEESRVLFNARFYFFENREEDFFDVVGSYYHDWKNVDGLEDASIEKPLVVCGGGHDGKITKRLLGYWGYRVVCFYDKYKKGTIEGLEILSVEEIKEKYKDLKFIVASNNFKYEIFHDLIMCDVDKERIIIPKYRYMYSVRGNQYFDVFPYQKGEVFIDAGTYDGKTILDFIKWSESDYNEVIAFEPIHEMYKKVVRQFSDFHNISVHNYAVWNQEDELLFVEAGVGSHQNCNGNTIVKAVDIDRIVGEKKVSFIKMDVEGSEMNALIGASKTIRRDHPRLAICIYHKEIDFIKLSSYILQLYPEYKLYIRHYTSYIWETVLYAIDEQE